MPFEPLFINPQKVTLAFKSTVAMDDRFRFAHANGLVLGGDWDLNVRPNEDAWKYRAVVAHFRGGTPWQETEAIRRTMDLIAERGSYEKMRTVEDVIARYERLDRVYDEICEARYFKTRKELGLTWWSERGGIYGHINRQGEFLRFHDGNHRFAIAQCAGLTEIPVQVGIIHRDAVKAGVIRQMRKRSMEG